MIVFYVSLLYCTVFMTKNMHSRSPGIFPDLLLKTFSIHVRVYNPIHGLFIFSNHRIVQHVYKFLFLIFLFYQIDVCNTRKLHNTFLF